ncbi:MAG: ABC transporter ATP-binding protein [Gammaproteobacteria bacterium]|nr:ABC transporter ATP-binding protein [Gammaproteobacteria bacterium]
MPGETLLKVEDLSRFYGPLQAVRNIDFEVRHGEVLGFLGPNGAGKTTTMQMLTGNLAPSTGRITVAGHDLLEDPRAAKAAIGYLPEQPPVYRDLTVDEYLDTCAALNRIERGKRRAARESAKAKCGLQEVGKRLIGNLSKGYQQRVGIAQAIIHLPPVIILDEPTAGLDPIQIREIRNLIRELGQDHSVILSTHILPEVQGVCTHVQIISRGTLVLDDSIEGLTRRMQSSSLMLRFRNAPAPDALTGLAGVTSVETTPDGSLCIYHDPSTDPTDDLVRLAVEKHWGLQALIPQQASLEDIFVELTATETPHAENAA